MCTSKSAATGCIAGIFRGILCSRSLPTHPSDYITEGISGSIDKHQGLNVENKIDAPGVVARLMGIDAMPEIDQPKPNSISRSRSMNSVDYKHGSDQVPSYTMSFRKLEDEEFFVLSFENEVNLRGAKQGKQRKGKNSRTEKASEGKNEETMSKKALCVLIEEEMNRRTSDKTDDDFAKSTIRALERKRKKKKGNSSKVENAEHECGPEDSSPVSVVDFDRFIVDQQIPDSNSNSNSLTDEDLKLEGSRRKLSAELENHGSPCQREDDTLMDSGGKSPRPRKKEWDRQFWDRDVVCGLTETEVGNSVWLDSKTEEVEDIAAAVGLQILAQLLDELKVLKF